MTKITAHKLDAIKPSATLAVSAKAAELKAQGIDVISLGSGEPDFATPAHIKAAAIAAIEANKSYYTPVDGTASLKEAIKNKLHHDNDLDYSMNQILVSSGAKQSVYNTCQALLNPGDEVIIPAPYWVSYPSIVLLSEAKPVIVKTTQAADFKITPDQLEQAITNKTKLFILNSPSNPTGMVYSHAELKALANVLLKYPQVYIISDDIYEHICWAEQSFKNIVMECPKLYDRTIVINGVSKAYAMTGWRIGYAAGPEVVIKAMKKLQSQSTSNACSIAQAAAEAALRGSQDCVADMVATYQQRQKFVLEGINALPGFTCNPTQGAFYLFPAVSGAINKLSLKDDIELCAYLLEQAQVAVVPGSAFGAANHIRLSYATSDAMLTSALERIGQALS
jgi:aspartate aminotransferase